MKVKELITELLDCDMNAEIELYLNKPFDDEYGRCDGYIFHIDKINDAGSFVDLEFTDWRDEEE